MFPKILLKEKPRIFRLTGRTGNHRGEEPDPQEDRLVEAQGVQTSRMSRTNLVDNNHQRRFIITIITVTLGLLQVAGGNLLRVNHHKFLGVFLIRGAQVVGAEGRFTRSGEGLFHAFRMVIRRQ
jgi:hypothetical protein